MSLGTVVSKVGFDAGYLPSLITRADSRLLLLMGDLGVRISSELSFKTHIANTVTAASRLVGWGLRTFQGRRRGLMLTLLRSLVQRRLEYRSEQHKSA